MISAEILKTVSIIGSILLGFGCLFLICKCKICNNIKRENSNERDEYTNDGMRANL